LEGADVTHPDISTIFSAVFAPADKMADRELRRFLKSRFRGGKRELPPKHRHHQRTLRPPDGLLTASEAAVKLRCSVKTLNGHVAAGALKYATIGHGTKRPRKRFTDADLDQFIANQTRKDVPACPSSARSARRTGITTSNGEVIGFTARRNAKLAAKRKQ
jgi:hypothetical protein